MFFGGVDALIIVEDHVVLTVLAWWDRPPGVEEQGMDTLDPPGTWEASPSPFSGIPVGGPETKPQASRLEHRPSRGANEWRRSGTPKRRQRSAGGRAARSRSVP
jgi:hypothetical protein